MEYSVMLSSLEAFENISESYARVYFGNAFCPNLQCNLESIKRLVEKCEVNKKELTLVTSYMTEESMERLDRVLAYLRSCEKKYEIVVNDWGLLYFINSRYFNTFNLILGRLLNKIKKTPLMLNIFEKLNVDSQLALQTASSNFPGVWELYRKYGIRKVEFENILQENRFSKDFPLEKTLLYPYVFISNSRKCITDYIFQAQDEYDIKSCKKCCEDMEINLFNKVMCRDVVLKGCTYFYMNIRLPANVEEYSRIIVQDNVPFDFKVQ